MSIGLKDGAGSRENQATSQHMCSGRTAGHVCHPSVGASSPRNPSSLPVTHSHDKRRPSVTKRVDPSRKVSITLERVSIDHERYRSVTRGVDQSRKRRSVTKVCIRHETRAGNRDSVLRTSTADEATYCCILLSALVITKGVHSSTKNRKKYKKEVTRGRGSPVVIYACHPPRKESIRRQKMCPREPGLLHRERLTGNKPESRGKLQS